MTYEIQLIDPGRSTRPLVVGTSTTVRGARIAATQAWRDYVDILRKNNRCILIVDRTTGEALRFSPDAETTSP